MDYDNKMQNYEPLIPSLNKPFSELNKKEADEYFNWFISNVDERADYLSSIVAKSLGIPKTEINLSVNSLKLIWKWFLQVAEIAETPKEDLKQIRNSLKGQPQSYVEHIVNQYKDGLSVFTEYVLRDIGMYVAKVFLENYACLHWDIRYKPKSYIHVNVPLIVGFVDDNPDYPKVFYPELEPIDLARTPAMNLFSGDATENDLYNRCLQWLEWIDDNHDNTRDDTRTNQTRGRFCD